MNSHEASTYSLSHLTDQVLLRDLSALVAQERSTTAALLAHIAEFDARRLYLPAGYPSMHAYCVHELRLSEDAASKRIQAARAARKFPAILEALAEGRLHLTAVGLLSPHLTRENADELLATAAYKTKAEIDLLVARRFPKSEMLAMVQPLPGTQPRADRQLAPAHVESPDSERVSASTDELALAQVGSQAADDVRGFASQHAPAHVEVPAPRSQVKPHAPERFALHLTMGQVTYDKLRYAQELLSHSVPSGDVAEVLDRALEALILKLEKRKFAATNKPRPGQRRSSASKRYVPAEVKRAVWKRDQGQCTFVSEAGRRCPSRSRLEFDHIDEVARGGQSTADRMRLRCRAHNQYSAERTFGAAFMSHKREAARRAAAGARVQADARASAEGIA